MKRLQEQMKSIFKTEVILDFILLKRFVRGKAIYKDLLKELSNCLWAGPTRGEDEMDGTEIM